MVTTPFDPPLSTVPSLYIHIPFCTRRCGYCAFYAENQGVWLPHRDTYLERLEQELDALLQSYNSGFPTIFLGGGNPGCLGPDRLAHLLSLAQKHGRPTECSIEINPETFNSSLFPLLEKKLITRISMGIQSMDDTVLSTLGRNAQRSDNLRAIALAREAHELYDTELSFDLMLCLPGQTLEMALADIDEIMALASPDHISLYCLTVEEGTDLSMAVSQGALPVLDEDGQEAFLWGVWQHLRSLGFRHYEVSNFARKEKLCKHNLTYWNLDSYIGLGCSAVSAIRREKTLSHITQKQDLATFVQDTLYSGYEKEKLSDIEHIEEYFMMALRTDFGIDKAAFFTRFNRCFDTEFASVIDSLDSRWFLSNKQSFSLTEIGFMVLDEIVLRFALVLL